MAGTAENWGVRTDSSSTERHRGQAGTGPPRRSPQGRISPKHLRIPTTPTRDGKEWGERQPLPSRWLRSRSRRTTFLKSNDHKRCKGKQGGGRGKTPLHCVAPANCLPRSVCPVQISPQGPSPRGPRVRAQTPAQSALLPALSPHGPLPHTLARLPETSSSRRPWSLTRLRDLSPDLSYLSPIRVVCLCALGRST